MKKQHVGEYTDVTSVDISTEAPLAPVKGRKPVPQGETKSQRFSRLATKRVGKAVRCLKYVGNLSDRSNYEYTEDQVSRIITILGEAVGRMVARFDKSPDQREEFEQI